MPAYCHSLLIDAAIFPTDIIRHVYTPVLFVDHDTSFYLNVTKEQLI